MRHDVAIYGSRQIDNIQVIVTSRFGGRSAGVFAELNLGAHVGDDADVMNWNRNYVRDLVDADQLAFMNQYHSNVVHRIDANSPITDGDGLITTTPDLAIAAFSADCSTFALVDPVAQLIAVGHSGWKGLAVGLPDALVGEFLAAGADPTRTTAIIAPSICGPCYEVPAERVDELRPICPEAITDATHIDVTTGVFSVISNYGIDCDIVGGCTHENPSLYSFRRDGVTGRNAIVAVINSQTPQAA